MSASFATRSSPSFGLRKVLLSSGRQRGCRSPKATMRITRPLSDWEREPPGRETETTGFSGKILLLL